MAAAITLAKLIVGAASFAAAYPYQALAASESVAGDPVSAATPAERRATEIVDLIRSVGAAEDWAADALAPQLSARSDALVHFISGLRDRSRGINDVRIEADGPHAAHVSFKSALTGRWTAFGVRVDPEAPHRVTGISPRRASPPSDHVPHVPDSEAERLAAIDEFAQRLAAADLFSGVVLVARNGVPVLEGAYGLADRERGIPNDMDTRFNLGSMNKAFTAIAIAQLVEQGQLSWDDPLSRFIPDFLDRESAAKVRIKHLLTHTSGLGSYFNERFAAMPMSHFRDIDSYLDVARGEPLRFEPGEGWFYSNTGMLLLGRVIERVTGEDYYDYIRRNVYDLADMSSTGSFLLDQPEPNTAIPYEVEYADGARVHQDATGMLPVRGSPAGGGLSTARDLLRFSNALRSGRLVAPETLELMKSPKPELNAERYGYGIAMERFAAPERGIFGHGGDAEGTCAVWGEVTDTGTPYTVIILSNSSGMSCHPLAERAYELLPPQG